MATKTQQIVYSQLQETVKQQKENVTIRMGTITCVCGVKRGTLLMYKCLYCNIFFCTTCAEQHFGKTIKEYREEKNEPE